MYKWVDAIRPSRSLKFYLSTLYQGVGRLLSASWALPLTLVLGFTLRAIALVFFWQQPLVSDARSYHQVAIDILNGNVSEISLYWPPGLPLFLAGLYKIVGVSEQAARSAMLFFSYCTILLAAIIAYKIGSRRTAVIVALLLGLYPPAIHHSVEPLTQSPTAMLLLVVVLSAVLFSRADTIKYQVFLVTFSGLALSWVILIRPSSTILAFCLLGYLLIISRKILFVALPFAIILVLVGSWIFYVSSVTKGIVPINYANSYNIFMGNNSYTPMYKTWLFGSKQDVSDGVPVEYRALVAQIHSLPVEHRDEKYRHLALTHITDRPDLFVIRTLSRVRCFFAFDTYSGSVIINLYKLPLVFGLGIIGLSAICYLTIICSALTTLFADKVMWAKPKYFALMLFVVLVYAFPYWLAFSHPIYQFPIVPLLSIIAAVGLDKSLSKSEYGSALIPRTRWRLFGLAFTLGVFFLVQIEWITVMAARV